MAAQYMSKANVAIAYLSTDDLEELLSNDEKLEERNSDVLKALNEEKEVIIAENRTLAEDNMMKDPQIVELKTRVSELSAQGKSLCESVQEKLSEIETKKCDKTPETALALLQTAASESESKSEDIIIQLKEREINVDEFLEQFMVARKEMHMRKLKSDKLVDLIHQQQANDRNIVPSSPYAQPIYPSTENIYPTAAPYPTGPYNMPLPDRIFRHF